MKFLDRTDDSRRPKKFLLMPDQRATGRVFGITILHGVRPFATSCALRVGIRAIEERIIEQ